MTFSPGILEEQKLPNKHHEERRKMSLQAKCLYFGRSGGWDSWHAGILAPVLLEAGEPR